MNILAITACPTGIAHTYMAAEQLENTAKKLGYQIKVETQGAMGIENEITPQEAASADILILAADTMVEKMERFDQIARVEVSVQKAIKDPESVFALVVK